MSDICNGCRGLIMEQGKCYGYAGKVCHCTSPHYVTHPMFIPRPTDDRVSKLVEAAQAALDGGVFKHPSIKEKLQQALEAL